jgi:hypothetical protein
MSAALIGYTGFVGGNLARQSSFDLLVNRANLSVLRGRHLGRLVCAGLPAAKWIANKEPKADKANIDTLCRVLDTVTAERVVIVSTIDVYPVNSGADEGYECDGLPNHAYGTHRLAFERFMRARFPHAQIVRLPALFGPGLKKNVIYDLLHDNATEGINPNSRFQWYPVLRLHQDLQVIEASKLLLVNLFTEPILTRDILESFFPGKTVGQCASPSADYDLRSRHAALFGGHDGYVLDRQTVLDELARYITKEQSAR